MIMGTHLACDLEPSPRLRIFQDIAYGILLLPVLQPKQPLALARIVLDEMLDSLRGKVRVPLWQRIPEG